MLHRYRSASDHSIGTAEAVTELLGELAIAGDPAPAPVNATLSSASRGCGGARSTRDNAPALSTAGRSSPKVAESSDEREREVPHNLGQDIALANQIL